MLLFRGADRTVLNYSNQDAFDVAIISSNTELAHIIKNFRQEDVGEWTFLSQYVFHVSRFSLGVVLYEKLIIITSTFVHCCKCRYNMKWKMRYLSESFCALSANVRGLHVHFIRLTLATAQMTRASDHRSDYRGHM